MPGEQGGTAVARTLFGAVSPSGKLPVTFPRSVDQLPPFEDYSLEGRTCRYMEADPLYPFGFGLSYARFAYSGESAPARVAGGESVTVTAAVTNCGATAAMEAVQCYITDEEASVRVPRARLCGVKRVFLAPGESTQVEFLITPDAMSAVMEDGSLRVEPGQFTITIGGCSPATRGVELGAPEPVSVSFEVQAT